MMFWLHLISILVGILAVAGLVGCFLALFELIDDERNVP